MGQALNGALVYAACALGDIEIRKYALFGRFGTWVADVVVEYQAHGSGTLTLQIVSKCGNYVYRWDACGGKGFAAFLLNNSDEYIAERLSEGHAAARELDAKQTRQAIAARLMRERAGEDSDWLGEALFRLEGCECEGDFYSLMAEFDIYSAEADFAYEWGWRVKGLRDTVIPALKNALKEELGDGQTEADERTGEEGAREDSEGAA